MGFEHHSLLFKCTGARNSALQTMNSTSRCQYIDLTWGLTSREYNLNSFITRATLFRSHVASLPRSNLSTPLLACRLHFMKFISYCENMLRINWSHIAKK